MDVELFIGDKLSGRLMGGGVPANTTDVIGGRHEVVEYNCKHSETPTFDLDAAGLAAWHFVDF